MCTSIIGDGQRKILPPAEKKGKCLLAANYPIEDVIGEEFVLGSMHICLVYNHKFTIKLDFWATICYDVKVYGERNIVTMHYSHMKL